MKHMVKFTALVCCSLAAASLFADPATGWKQTAGGTYDYNAAENWVDGKINGIFGSDLTLEGAQTITFSQDTTLPNGLTFNHAGAYKITMKSADANTYTLTLGGDIENSSKGSVEPEATLAFNLGEETRTIACNGAAILIHGVISNGGIIFTGTSDLRLYGANTFAGGFVDNSTGYIYPNNSSAFGTGTVTFNGGNKLNNTSSVTVPNAVVLNGNLTKSGEDKSFTFSGPLTINVPLTIEVTRNTLTFSGSLSQDSPCKITDITKAAGGNLSTSAGVEIDGTDVIRTTSGTWYFNGAVSGTGPLIVRGQVEMKGTCTFDGDVRVESGSLRLCAKNVLPASSKVYIAKGATFKNYQSNGYGIATMINGGRIDPSSEGTFGIAENEEDQNIDLSNYPKLILAPSGNNRTVKGSITAPQAGVLRLGGGSKTLTLGGTIIGATEIDASTGSIQFNASQPNFDGRIKCGQGYTLTVGSSVELANADLVSDGGTIRFASATAGEFTRARSVTLKTAHLTIDSPSAGATTHKITGALIVDVCTVAAGGIPSVTLANSGANDLVLSAGSVSKSFDAGMLHVMNSVTGEGTAKFIIENTDALGLVGSGDLNSERAPVSPFVRVNNSLATYEANVGLRALNSNEYVLFNEDYEGPITSEGANILVSGGVTVTINSPSRINSLMLASDGSAHPVLESSDASMTVLSGAVGFMSTATADTSCPQCSAELDFGSRRAYISYASGRYCKISSAMHGTGGVIVAECAPTAHESIGIHLRSVDSDISGDSYVFGCVMPKASVNTQNYPAYSTSAFFPCGADRPGDLYVYGRVRLAGGGLPINGLYGCGAIECTGSGQSAIYVGCDGSDGEFTGSFVDNGTGANLHAYKYGTGKQRYTANMGWKYSSFDPGAGELQLDGSLNMLNGGIGIGANLTLSGCATVAAKSGNKISFKSGSILAPGSAEMPGKPMTFKNEVEMQAGASMKFYIGADRASQAIVAEGYGITGTATTIPVTVDCTVKKKGSWLLLEADTFNEKAFAFTTRPSGGRLVVKNDETTNRAQLWFEQTTGFSVTLR